MTITVVDNGVNVHASPRIHKVTVQKGHVTYNITNDQVFGEVPSGLINGSNATFTTANSFVPSSVQVFVNGVNQYNPTHFTTTGTTTIILTASPIVGDILTVNYLKHNG